MRNSIALMFVASTFLLAGCCTTPHIAKWEYKVAVAPVSGTTPQEWRQGTQMFLNDLGKDGWVLVSEADGRTFYLKRPIK
jgi:hypothetical protein